MFETEVRISKGYEKLIKEGFIEGVEIKNEYSPQEKEEQKDDIQSLLQQTQKDVVS